MSIETLNGYEVNGEDIISGEFEDFDDIRLEDGYAKVCTCGHSSVDHVVCVEPKANGKINPLHVNACEEHGCTCTRFEESGEVDKQRIICWRDPEDDEDSDEGRIYIFQRL